MPVQWLFIIATSGDVPEQHDKDSPEPSLRRRCPGQRSVSIDKVLTRSPAPGFKPVRPVAKVSEMSEYKVSALMLPEGEARVHQCPVCKELAGGRWQME